MRTTSNMTTSRNGEFLEESIFLRFEQLRIILMITRSTHGMGHRNISGAERQNMHQKGRKKQFDEGFRIARKNCHDSIMGHLGKGDS